MPMHAAAVPFGELHVEFLLHAVAFCYVLLDHEFDLDLDLHLFLCEHIPCKTRGTLYCVPPNLDQVN